MYTFSGVALGIFGIKIGGQVVEDMNIMLRNKLYVVGHEGPLKFLSRELVFSEL